MKKRAFGRTGLQVSEVIFGGGSVGGIVIQKDDATKREAIRRAMAGGINWVDTAQQYGNGKSEEALGWLLPESGANPYVSTKFNLDVENLTDIPGQIEERLMASLARLRRKSVDLLQLHNRIGSKPGGRVMTVERILGKDGVADGLERLRERGLIRHMGITALGEAPSVCEVIRSGRFDSAQVYYNLLNPSAARAMPQAWTGHRLTGIIDACREHHVAVMAIRIFAAGVIATDERTGRESILTADTSLAEEERKAKVVFEAIGSGEGTRGQVALRFVLSNPDISCAIIGISELHHIDEALQAAEMGPLPAAVLRQLDALYESDFGRAR
ncbi:MAG TPA: aldo/keto reductase [Burkholderiales bacterium]|jgi:L-galactose dehydrogenase/L-glyceraldehyde 3-phosphate reductase|nr:aldo/keto reductase [Burkholderiales bacterium]